MYLKKSNLSLQIIATAIALGSMGTACADTAAANFVPSWYIGAGVAADHRFSDTATGTFVDTKTHTPITATDSFDQSLSLGWSVIGGYHASTHWAFELGYYDQGTHEMNNHYTTASGDVHSGSEKGHDYDATLSTLAILPVPNSAFSVYLRTGLGYHRHTDTSDVDANNFVSNHGDEEGSHFIYGFGTQYEISSHFSARAEYTLFDADALIQNLKGGRATLSAIYSF